MPRRVQQLRNPSFPRRRESSLLQAAAITLVTLGCVLVCGVVAAQDNAGRTLFDAACAHCHGADGRGGQLGPSLLQRVNAETNANLTAFLRKGSPERGMPPAAVTDAQLPTLIAYLHTLVAAAPPPTSTATTASTTTVYRPIARYTAIDDKTLLNPDANDWLWFNRTPDSQRFSPLKQIDSHNVSKLALHWARSLPNGLSYTIPVVHDGVMYLTTPNGGVQALDATNGDPIWDYQRKYANAAQARQGRGKSMALYADMVYYLTGDNAIVALDAKTGALRWEASTGRRNNAGGLIVVNGKVISGGTCAAGPRDACYISAHDALTGKQVWQFNTIQEKDPTTGVDSWNGVPLEQRLASPWGLPGSYDPVTKLLYWGIANPMPTTRGERHGNATGVGTAAPTDLYSNSTVALDPDTGRLQWYYQHLPGDDWDLDMNEDRTLLRTALKPDPKFVKWINPKIKAGEVRDVVAMVGEGGGLWLLDRTSGEFLWSTPFPFDVPNYFLKDIDVTTGKTYINDALIVATPGERHIVCYFNTRSFWPMAYSPDHNSLYVPYVRNCLDISAADPAHGAREGRRGSAEPGVPEAQLNGLAKIDLATGEIAHWTTGRYPTTSAVLATAGNLVFWGDINHRYRAMDAATGKVLWETVLGGPVSMSNITYSVNGTQYVAVIAGETLAYQTLTRGGLGPIPLDLGEPTGDAALYVFALPTTKPTTTH
ncbi:MAG TPA: PQQ-binding-like beta-propeller repeat protein [Candidatus Acidoferrum sp.]|nr:PQQ-binding-like beta-propeller repeat protein [Candidatus Acidoferrum sp.]